MPFRTGRRGITRTRYFVQPRPGNKKGWEVRRELGKRASSKHRKKSTAVKAGRRIAKKNKPAQLIIKDSDGRFQKDHTFPRRGRAGDPFPPRG